MLVGFWEYFEIPNIKERYFNLIGRQSWAKAGNKHGLCAIPSYSKAGMYGQGFTKMNKEVTVIMQGQFTIAVLAIGLTRKIKYIA
jgi:hypothetical protein